MSDESSIDSDDFIWDDRESAAPNRSDSSADDHSLSASSSSRHLETVDKTDYERYFADKLSQQAVRQHSSHSSVDLTRFEEKHSRSPSIAHSRQSSNMLNGNNVRILPTAGDDDDIDIGLISALEKIADRTQSFKASPSKSKLPRITNELDDGSLPATQPTDSSTTSDRVRSITLQYSSKEPPSRSARISKQASNTPAPNTSANPVLSSKSGIASVMSTGAASSALKPGSGELLKSQCVASAKNPKPATPSSASQIDSTSTGAEQSKPSLMEQHSDISLVLGSTPAMQTEPSKRRVMSSKPTASAETGKAEKSLSKTSEDSSRSNPQRGIHSGMTERKTNISTADKKCRGSSPPRVDRKEPDPKHSVTPADSNPRLLEPKQGQSSSAATMLSDSHLNISESEQARHCSTTPVLLDQIASSEIGDILRHPESLEISSKKSVDHTEVGMSDDNTDQQQLGIANNDDIGLRNELTQQTKTRSTNAPWLPHKNVPLQGRRPRSPSPCRNSSKSHSCPNCVHKKFYDFPRKKLEMALIQAVRSGVDVDRLMQFMKEDPGTKQLGNLMAVIMKLKTTDSRKSRSRLETSRPSRTPRRKPLTQPGAVQ